jgi:hypothetical protein
MSPKQQIKVEIDSIDAEYSISRLVIRFDAAAWEFASSPLCVDVSELRECQAFRHSDSSILTWLPTKELNVTRVAYLSLIEACGVGGNNALTTSQAVFHHHHQNYFLK